MGSTGATMPRTALARATRRAAVGRSSRPRTSTREARCIARAQSYRGARRVSFVVDGRVPTAPIAAAALPPYTFRRPCGQCRRRPGHGHLRSRLRRSDRRALPSRAPGVWRAVARAVRPQPRRLAWTTGAASRRRAALRRIREGTPTALGDLHDAAPHAGAIRRARGRERRVRLLHVDPHRRARVVLLDLIVGREARRASRPHAERWLYRRPGQVASGAEAGRVQGVNKG